MKKIITSLLIAALAAGSAVAAITYGGGFITVTGASSLTLTITGDFGGSKGFGYYRYDPETGQRGELIPLDVNIDGTFSIDGLAEGDSISFYTEHAGQGTIFGDEKNKKGDFMLSDLGGDEAAEEFGLKFHGNKNGMTFSISPATPTGQPMPGVVFSGTLGLAAVCAVLIINGRRKKKVK